MSEQPEQEPQYSWEQRICVHEYEPSPDGIQLCIKCGVAEPQLVATEVKS